jgi:NADH:ubiquinone oxidoreductase subunit K
MLGLYGIMIKRNAIRVLFGVELIYNSANVTLVALARHFTPPTVVGQIATLFTIAIAASEAVVFLALILVIFRVYGSIDIHKLRKLKG